MESAESKMADQKPEALPEESESQPVPEHLQRQIDKLLGIPISSGGVYVKDIEDNNGNTIPVYHDPVTNTLFTHPKFDVNTGSYRFWMGEVKHT